MIKNTILDGMPTLHAAFERVVELFPDRLAIVDDESALTYAELDARANALAATLREAGVGRGLVGVRCHRSAALAVAILGILKSGAAYVPIDPDTPEERLRFILADSSADALVVDQPAPDGSFNGPIIRLADVPATPASQVATGAGGDDLAYVIYTSGSTGRPKGVMVEHQQVLALLRAANGVFSFDENDVWTLFHSYAFDFSVWEIFGALLTGGSLVVAPLEVSRSPQAMWQLIQREGVTVLNQTPSAFARLAEADQGFGADLRYVVFGGEALDFRRLGRWYDRYGDSGPQLVNMYGITETTVHVTYRMLSRADAGSPQSLIGRPLPHLSLRLLDQDRRPVPPGETGELYVGGSGLARGYLGRPELTAARFAHDDRGERLYRSGDLGRLRPDGDIEYLGRTDDQVKVRGYRIEPGEIQARLREHASIADAVVTIWRGTENVQLVGYLVGRPGGTPTDEQIRGFLGHTLPAHMVPGIYVWLERLPLNHNGKLDRASLPTPTGSANAATADGTGTMTERLLAIWREVLEIPGIGPDDPFYAVGGDSIQAVRVVAAAQTAGIALTIEDLTANPTVAALTRTTPSTTYSPDPATEPFSLIKDTDREAIKADVVDAHPVTSMQLGMLFHTESAAAHPIYHSVSHTTVKLPFDYKRMAGSLTRILETHEVLRTSFDVTSYSEPLALVHRSASPPMTVIDLGGRAPEAVRAALTAMLVLERRTPLPVGEAPLIRFRMVLLGPDEFEFIWSEHHAVLDGWSSNTLLAEVLRDYAGDPAPPRRLPSMRDYVAREAAAVDSPADREFWSRYLLGTTPAPAPRRPADVAEVDLHLPAGTYQRLSSAAGRLGLAPRSFLIAAAGVALGRVRRHRDAVVGYVSHGRLDQAGGDRALGLFLNTLPVRLTPAGSYRDVTERVDDDIRRAVPHRRFPLAAIVAATGVRLDVLVNVTEFHQINALVRDGLLTGTGVRNTVLTSFPVVVDAERQADGELNVIVQFQDEEWTPAAREAFGDAFVAELLAAVDSPDREVADAVPSVTALHDIVRTAADRPDTAAVRGAETELTYAELVSRAQAVAAKLADRGIGVGDTVAMRLPRTPDLLVATLGVWWAGATLVPLETDFPPERLRYVLHDSGAAIVLGDATGLDVPGLDLDGLEATVGGQPPRCRAGDSAYVLYTSGSTGRPKGVVVDHHALREIMQAVIGVLGLTPDDTVLGWTPATFDIVFVEHVAALMAGARLSLLTDVESRDPQLVVEAVRRHGVTVVQGTPSKVATIAELALPGVRAILCGGEPLPPHVVNTLVGQGITVFNGYGPTEATVYATMQEITTSQEASVPIGSALPGVRLRIDEATGELWIGGAGLSRGYLHQPSLTDAAFVTYGGDRFYRSGDQVRRTGDGSLLYLGRLDQQIKINGVRIEIGEVEHQIAEHPAVSAVAVVLDGDTLTAYVVPGDSPIDPVDLRAFLAARVPEAMIPRRWLFTRKLGLTSSGKVDRRLLTAAGAPAATETLRRRSLSGEKERLVAEVWRTVLGREPAGRDDRFSDLGGDSLAAMRAVGQFARHGVVVRAAQLLLLQTLGQQADIITVGETDA